MSIFWIHLLLVGAGGFIGAASRYVIAGLAHRLDPAGPLPYGTIAVNVLGCLAIGLLAGIADTRQVITPAVRHFLFIGVLGGFTTFSTFSHESLVLLRDGHGLYAALNVFGTLILCLLFVWAGYSVGSIK